MSPAEKREPESSSEYEDDDSRDPDWSPSQGPSKQAGSSSKKITIKKQETQVSPVSPSKVTTGHTDTLDSLLATPISSSSPGTPSTVSSTFVPLFAVAKSWTCDMVATVVKKLWGEEPEIGEVVSKKFLRSKIDGATFLTLTNQNLKKDLGLDFGPAHKISNFILEIRGHVGTPRRKYVKSGRYAKSNSGMHLAHDVVGEGVANDSVSSSSGHNVNVKRRRISEQGGRPGCSRNMRDEVIESDSSTTATTKTTHQEPDTEMTEMCGNSSNRQENVDLVELDGNSKSGKETTEIELQDMQLQLFANLVELEERQDENDLLKVEKQSLETRCNELADRNHVLSAELASVKNELQRRNQELDELRQFANDIAQQLVRRADENGGFRG